MMLQRWRSNPISFIETVLHDPETKKPFKLLPAERAFLEHAFKRDDDGRLLLSRADLLRAPRKVGKTTFARNSYADHACCCSVAAILRRRSARTIRNKASVACSR